MILIPPDRTATIANRLCGYCGEEIGRRERTRDHVVARRFVPEGTLMNSCNVGLWACAGCNGLKSGLEDDISAITMMPDVYGRFARDDTRLRRTAARKLKGAVSIDTRKPVAKSRPNIGFNMPFANASMSMNYVGAPRIADERAAQLAWMQIQGFWFFQTFERGRGHGKFLPAKDFHFAGMANRADWGNERIATFTTVFLGLEPQFHATLADGYFRAGIRGFPDGENLAWAIEWNEMTRCYGYWGPGASRRVRALPEPRMEFLAGDTTNGIAVRREVSLSEADDRLFKAPAEMADAVIPERPHWL